MNESVAPLVSIILPIHNQADHVERVVREYDSAVANLRLQREFILVVNGPSEDSYQACLRVAESVNCRVLRIAGAGWGLAVKLGLSEARGDIIAYTNAARTTGRELALVLLHAAIDRTVVVKASRKIRDSASRRIGSLLFNLECRAFFDLASWDVNGTPKAFPRQFEPLRKLSRADDLIDLEFVIVCKQQQYPMIEVPIFSSRRHGGHSTTNLNTAWRMYTGALRLWWQFRRHRQSNAEGNV